MILGWRALFGSTFRHRNYSNQPLFDKILIANRGEIACRIIRTARKHGVKTVAIYSDADLYAKHVEEADEAYRVGKPPSQESYLRIDEIVKLCQQTSAKAVHPGYGFLSENAAFASRLASEGIVFIGPSERALRDMGSKSASKRIMQEAGVPVVPGYHGDNQDPKHLLKEARRIGFPIMLKAVLGGGGKGMRIVKSEDQFEEMLQSAKRESKKSFADERILLEKYIEKSRHIEVQIFGDQQGNIVYLWERDCSVQRRHQKVLEEAPALEISEEQRRKLGELAVAAAKAVQYVGAGTVEFIFDVESEQFYFMEMNTRLQVEHPVTEMITGLDLVYWQLLTASGNTLPLQQDQIPRFGHAIEARIYAENTEKGFLPDTGQLEFLRLPRLDRNIRVETAVQEGDEISVYYDPMIAKVIAWGEDRPEAVRSLDAALSEMLVVGPHTNIAFVRRILQNSQFNESVVDTGFIKANEKQLQHPQAPTVAEISMAAVLFLKTKQDKVTADPWSGGDAFRNFGRAQVSVELLESKNQRLFKASVAFLLESNTFEVVLDDKQRCEIRLLNLNATEAEFVVDKEKFLKARYRVGLEDDSLDLFLRDSQVKFHLARQTKDTREDQMEDQDYVNSPMPCRIGQIFVKTGQEVRKGSPLVVVEAMKMEHVIRSPRDGKIKKIYYSENELVAQSVRLVELA